LQDNPGCCYHERGEKYDFVEMKILGEMGSKVLNKELQGKFIVLDGPDGAV
jgi:hypothetical protein